MDYKELKKRVEKDVDKYFSLHFTNVAVWTRFLNYFGSMR